MGHNETPDLWNFLAASFHQDIGSPEKALEELLQEESTGYLQHAVEFISEYLNSDAPESVKNEFIGSSTFIYFPARGLTPVQWLEGVLHRIERELQDRKGSRAG